MADTLGKELGFEEDSEDIGFVADGGVEFTPGPEKSTGRRVFEGTMKGLDYPGGAVRTAIAGALGALEPGEAEQFATGEAHAPGIADIMKRKGVGELGRLSNAPGIGKLIKKDSFADVTGRGALGLVGDMATDPLSYVGALKKLLIGSGTKGVGRAERIAAATKTGAIDAAHGLDKLSPSVGRGILEMATGFGPSDVLARIGERARVKSLVPIVESLPPHWQRRALNVFDKYKIHGSPKAVYSKIVKYADVVLPSEVERIGIGATKARAYANILDMVNPLEKHLQKLVKEGYLDQKSASKIFDKMTKPKLEMPTGKKIPKLDELGQQVLEKKLVHVDEAGNKFYKELPVMVDEFAEEVPIALAKEWKTATRKSISDTKWAKKLNPTQQNELEMILSGGMQEGILKGLRDERAIMARWVDNPALGKKAVEDARKLADELEVINKDWGTLISSKAKAEKLKSTRGTPLAEVVGELTRVGKTGLAGAAASTVTSPQLATLLGATFYGASKARNMLTGPRASKYGTILRNLMEHPGAAGVDSAYRQLMIQSAGKGNEDEEK